VRCIDFLWINVSDVDFNFSFARNEGGWSFLDHDLFPFLSGWFVDEEGNRIIHLSKEIVVAGGIKVVQLYLEVISFNVIGMKGEFFIPEWIQSFLNNFGFLGVVLIFNSHFHKRITSTTKVSSLNTSGFNDFHHKFRLVC